MLAIIIFSAAIAGTALLWALGIAATGYIVYQILRAVLGGDE